MCRIAWLQSWTVYLHHRGNYFKRIIGRCVHVSIDEFRIPNQAPANALRGCSQRSQSDPVYRMHDVQSYFALVVGLSRGPTIFMSPIPASVDTPQRTPAPTHCDSTPPGRRGRRPGIGCDRLPCVVGYPSRFGSLPFSRRQWSTVAPGAQSTSPVVVGSSWEAGARTHPHALAEGAWGLISVEFVVICLPSRSHIMVCF